MDGHSQASHRQVLPGTHLLLKPTPQAGAIAPLHGSYLGDQDVIRKCADPLSHPFPIVFSCALAQAIILEISNIVIGAFPFAPEITFMTMRRKDNVMLVKYIGGCSRRKREIKQCNRKRN